MLRKLTDNLLLLFGYLFVEDVIHLEILVAFYQLATYPRTRDNLTYYCYQREYLNYEHGLDWVVYFYHIRSSLEELCS